jgi:glycosyltransferase involved in cell wall biosynthesis
LAHGAEAWAPLSSFKRRMLKAIDLIIPFSDFTKDKMRSVLGIPDKKFIKLYSCLDPFLPPPADESRRSECRSSYGIADTDIVLMTLSRHSSKEKSKSYDKVLIAIKKLHASFPHLKYLFVGKYEPEEKERLDKIIHELGIEYDVTFTGFVPDTVIADYYNMADVYIMPGGKEDSDLSFIEALYYNKPVIAVNHHALTDTSVAGRLVTLVDSFSQEDIVAAIQKIIQNISAFAPNRELLLETFSYAVYKNNFRKVTDHF